MLKKFVSLLLAVLMLTVLLCACGEPKEPVKSDAVESEASETDAEPYETVIEGEGDEIVLGAQGEDKTLYVVYGTGAHYRVSGAANALKEKVRIATKSNMFWLSDSDERCPAPDAERIELLVGNSNRPESTAVLEGLHKNEYSVTFDGKKLVINALDPYGVLYAERLFVEKYVKGKTSLALKPGFSMKGTFETPETVKVLDSMKRGFNIFASYGLKGQEEWMYEVLVEGGFDHVRLPLNLSTCFDEDGEVIEEQVAYVDNAVNWGVQYGFVTVLDFHDWDFGNGYNEDANEYFYMIWEYFAERYKDMPATLCFELLNEPKFLDRAAYDRVQVEAVKRIRAIDEDRIIFLSTVEYNDANGLGFITVPENDDAIAIDIHDYTPGEFTHQGYAGRDPDIPYTEDCFAQWKERFDMADAYRHKLATPMIIGEFGVITNAEDNDEAAFLCDTTTYMEQHDLAWTLWEFSGIRQLYDYENKTWFERHMNAIMTDDYLLYNK